MATLKRNHTPKNTMCICSACEAIATAPDGKRHRHCLKPAKGKWQTTGHTTERALIAARS